MQKRFQKEFVVPVIDRKRLVSSPALLIFRTLSRKAFSFFLGSSCYLWWESYGGYAVLAGLVFIPDLYAWL